MLLPLKNTFERNFALVRQDLGRLSAVQELSIENFQSIFEHIYYNRALEQLQEFIPLWHWKLGSCFIWRTLNRLGVFQLFCQ